MDQFKYIPDVKVSKTIHDLVEKGSGLKYSLFKKIISVGSTTHGTENDFIRYINSLLQKWDTYANELIGFINTANPTMNLEGKSVIPYDCIKKYIYNKNDYASILPFMDGLITGIIDGDIISNKEMESFMNHTTRMAFNTQMITTAELLDSVLSYQGSLIERPATLLDIKMFDSIKYYNDIFNRFDYSVLYKSIQEAIRYLTDASFGFDINKFGNRTIFSSMLSYIVDYIVYSITVFITKIVMISKYIHPFISTSIQESKDHDDDTYHGEIELVSDVFQTMDESGIKDIKNTSTVLNKFIEFLLDSGSIGSTESVPKYNNDYVDEKILKDNKIHKELHEYPLYSPSSSYYSAVKESSIIEIHHNLKMQLHNPRQGLGGTSTDRNNILNTIRTITYGDDINHYRHLALDLYIVALNMTSSIHMRINGLELALKHSMKDHISHQKLILESLGFLNDWYKELIYAIIQKARYIERKMNDWKHGEVRNIINMTTINIPEFKPEVNQDEYLDSSNPHTSIFAEGFDLHAAPIFESLELYDEYLRSLPEFKDDLYLSEASGISFNANMLKSMIEGIIKRIIAFINGERFKHAQKWVTDNESTIRSLIIPENATMQILNYVEKIDFSVRFNYEKFCTALQNVNMDQLAKNPDEEIKKVYRSACDTQTFNAFVNNGPDVSKVIYRNLILFNSENKDETAPISIKGSEIQKRIPRWVDEIKSSDSILRTFNTMNTKITTAVNSVNTKLISLSNNQSTKPATQNKPGEAEKNQETDDTNNIAGISQKIQNVILNLWAPIAEIIIKTLLNEYTYIKTAYGLSTKVNQVDTVTTPSNNGDEQSNTSI